MKPDMNEYIIENRHKKSTKNHYRKSSNKPQGGLFAKMNFGWSHSRVGRGLIRGWGGGLFEGGQGVYSRVGGGLFEGGWGAYSRVDGGLIRGWMGAYSRVGEGLFEGGRGLFEGGRGLFQTWHFPQLK